MREEKKREEKEKKADETAHGPALQAGQPRMLPRAPGYRRTVVAKHRTVQERRREGERDGKRPQETLQVPRAERTRLLQGGGLDTGVTNGVPGDSAFGRPAEA